MNVPQRKTAVLATLLSLAGHWAATATPTMPPIHSLYGAYEIIGRAPGALGKPFRGWVRLAVEGDVIEVDRCVAGIHTSGIGRQVTLKTDDMTAIEFAFTRNNVRYKATCAYQSDFDNLPRFTCYTYPDDRPRVVVPGLEAYFPIIWPVPLEFFDCR